MSRNRQPYSPAALLETLEAWPEPEQYCVAFSGGIDSTALLAALAQSGTAKPFRAVHINHGLQPEADQWALHCERLCQFLGVPLEVMSVTVEQHGEGIETAARQARRQAFAETLETREVLLTGQHADDQAETLLLQALRGCGVEGLAGMAPIRQFAAGYMARPLLVWSRAELQSWLQKQSVAWIDDPSNRDTKIPRNFLRHRILPLLETHWPHPEIQLSRTARHCRELSDWQAAWAREVLGTAQQNERPAILDWSLLAERPRIQQQALIRHWLRQNRFPVPNQARLDEALRQFETARNDAEVVISWPDAELRFWQGRLYVTTPWPGHSGSWPVRWQSRSIELPDGLGRLQWLAVGNENVVDRQILELGLSVDYRRGGERLRLAENEHSKTLKQWLQEQSIPPWLRDRIPLIYQHDELVAVADRWASHEFTRQLASADLQLSWQPDPRFQP